MIQYTTIKPLDKPDMDKMVKEKWLSLYYERLTIKEKNDLFKEYIADLLRNKLITKEQADNYLTNYFYI